MEYGSINQMAEAYSSVKDYTVNGECSKCGNCCSRILPLTNKEINQIMVYIKNHNIKRQWHYPSVLKEQTYDCVCPFLDDTKENKCTIYELRPSVCRVFNCHDYIDGSIFSKQFNYQKATKVDAVKTFFPNN